MLINKLISKFLGLILIVLGGWWIYAYVLEHDVKYITPTEKQLKKYKISEDTALHLYQLMKDTHELFVKHEISYWIEGGTLLGAVRHEGLIPFDDDLDIAILHEDEPKLQNILSEFKKLGYNIRYNDAYNICKQECIDIFVFHKQDNRFICTNPNMKLKYPTDIFYEDELLPLKKYKFGELQVYGPQISKAYLDRLYLEWDKYAMLQQPHSFRFFITNLEKKIKFILTPELLKPAMPIGPLQNRVNFSTEGELL